jgi:hypothetical protein
MDTDVRPVQVLTAKQKTTAIGHFKDWTNYLLITTVAATGWIAQQPQTKIPYRFWREASLICFGLSIIAGICTLALIPLITEKIKDDGFPISTEKFYTVDDRSSHATKSNRTVIVWHLASS